MRKLALLALVVVSGCGSLTPSESIVAKARADFTSKTDKIVVPQSIDCNGNTVGVDCSGVTQSGRAVRASYDPDGKFRSFWGNN